MKKKALITGIDGFVGRYLTKYLLQQNLDVYGTSLNYQDKGEFDKEVKIYNMNVLNSGEVLDIIKAVKPDYVYHLAAQSSVSLSWKNPSLTMNVNIIGTINLLEAIKLTGFSPRILLIGSSEEYGEIKPEYLPLSESAPLQPMNPYAISKATQEMIGELYNKTYSLDIMRVRAFNHIGPGQEPIFVVSDFARQIAEIEKGLKPAVINVGNLDAKRDFSDVRDIVRGYYELMNRGKSGEVYNVGSGNVLSVREILERLIALSSENIDVIVDHEKFRAIDIPLIQCNNFKIKSDTNWNLIYDIEKSLKDILEYWRTRI